MTMPLCSRRNPHVYITSTIYLMVVFSTCSTEECELQLTEAMKNRSVVFNNVDMMLCKTECTENIFKFVSCCRAGDEPKKTEKAGVSSFNPDNHSKVLTESCGAKVCNETTRCLDQGCEKVCVEEPPLCDLHSASRTGNLSRVKKLLSQVKTNMNCKEWIGRTPVMWAAGKGHREVFEVLVSKGASLSLTDRFGLNILHSACLGGDVEVVKYVLSQNGVDINRKVHCGRTAVMLAAENGHKSVLELLVGKGTDVSLVDNTRNNILHCACRGGDVEVVKYILSLDSVDINSRGQQEKTPAMVAGEWGHKEVVEVLAIHEANLSLIDESDDNILHLACRKGHMEVVKYVLSLLKVDINCKGHYEKSPVMLAGQNGHKEIVELLVTDGATLSLKDYGSDTILHVACWYGHTKVLKYLLSLGKMDIDSRGWKKKTPVMVAGQRGYAEVVELFASNGANLTLRNSVGDNILHVSCWEGHVEIVKYVLSLGKVGINGRGWKNRTPFLSAGIMGHKEVMEMLVQNGANLSLTDTAGDNILHYVCRQGYEEVVKYVLSKDIIDINAMNNKGETAVSLASSQGRQEVVDLLVSHGANI